MSEPPQKKAKLNDGKQQGKKKKKISTKIRAHSNPLNDGSIDQVPSSPDKVNWNELFPNYFNEKNESIDGKEVEIVDVGSGFGGLLFGLSPVFPEKLILGMEIRHNAVLYINDRLEKRRAENPGKFLNIAANTVNVMKFLPNYFKKGQLEKMFFNFPDPHFKRTNHRRRIISDGLLTEYAYALKIGGKLYTITDVKDLYDWEVEKLEAHPLFEKITDEKELENDPCIDLIYNSTAEGQKVSRNKGSKWSAVYRRIEDPKKTE